MTEVQQLQKILALFEPSWVSIQTGSEFVLSQELNKVLEETCENGSLMDDLMLLISNYETPLHSNMRDQLRFWILMIHKYGICAIQNAYFEIYLQEYVLRSQPNELNELKGLLYLLDLIIGKSNPLYQLPDFNDLNELIQLREKLTRGNPQELKQKNIQSKFDLFYISMYIIQRYIRQQLKQELGQEDQLAEIDYLKILTQLWKEQAISLKSVDYLHKLKGNLPQENIMTIYQILVEYRSDIQAYQNKNNMNNLELQSIKSLLEENNKMEQQLTEVDEIQVFLKESKKKTKKKKLPKSLQPQQPQQPKQPQQPEEPEQPERKQSTQLKDRKIFDFLEKLDQDENQLYEYKNYSWPFDYIRIQTIKQVICSFANTIGGYLFIGIDDDACVKGIQLTRKERDELKLLILSEASSFHPQLDLFRNEVQVDFIPIRNQNKTKINGQFVVRITVQQGNPARLYTYQDRQNIVYGILRLDGRKQKLIYPKLMDFVYEKVQNPLPASERLNPAVPEEIKDLIDEKPKKRNASVQKKQKNQQNPVVQPMAQPQLQSPTQHPQAQHPLAQHPLAQHPLAQHPQAQHPLAQHQLAQHPQAQHPLAQHPPSQSPLGQKSSAPQPVQYPQVQYPLPQNTQGQQLPSTQQISRAQIQPQIQPLQPPQNWLLKNIPPYPINPLNRMDSSQKVDPIFYFIIDIYFLKSQELYQRIQNVCTAHKIQCELQQFQNSILIKFKNNHFKTKFLQNLRIEIPDLSNFGQYGRLRGGDIKTDFKVFGLTPQQLDRTKKEGIKFSLLSDYSVIIHNRSPLEYCQNLDKFKKVCSTSKAQKQKINIVCEFETLDLETTPVNEVQEQP